MPDTQKLRRFLRRKGIVELEKDMRLMQRAELAEHFASARSGRIVLARLLRNVIWQAYQRIQSGNELPIIGNLRTFYYRFVKPTLERFDDDEKHRKDPYDVTLRCFEQMVMDWQLFRYRDFDLADENWQNRHIGPKHPQVLVFAEKTGWSRFLRHWHKELGVSVFALGGFPSALSSEYTAFEMQKVLPAETEVHLLAIVDYDPSGWIIADSFTQQLKRCGLQVGEPTLLISPEHYKPDEIEMFAFELPRRQPTKQARWMEASGGIDGETKGLESESLPLPKLDQLLRQRLQEILDNE